MGKWKSLTASEKAKVIKFAIDNGISDINTIRDTYNMYADGGSIHIKPENRGKFTELKERTGKSSTWYKEHGTPEQRKMATFALNARKWNHKHEGTTSDSRLHIETNNKRSREEALLSAVKVFNNYIDAKDNQMGKIETAARIAAKYLADWNLNPLGSGISNCTLSTSQWVNPDNPLMRAASIVENPNPYFTKISKEYSIPGDILITKNPNYNSYHTMMITGFKDNIPLLTYSSGGTNTKKNLRKNILLSNYHQRDIEQGGNHTEDLYYRPLYNNEVTLPEIVVIPNGSFVNYDAKAQGGYLQNQLSKPFSYKPIPTVRYDLGGFLRNLFDLKGVENNESDNESDNKSENRNTSINMQELANRQAYAESGFTSDKVSPAGARGMFQIIPDVLEDYNKAKGTSHTKSQLSNDTINTDVRNWYFGEKLMNRPWVNKEGQNDSIRVAKALAAYNYGPSNTLKVLNKAKENGIDIYNGWDWMNLFPKETRDYINFILKGQNNSLHRNDSVYKITKSKESNKGKVSLISEKTK